MGKDQSYYFYDIEHSKELAGAVHVYSHFMPLLGPMHTYTHNMYAYGKVPGMSTYHTQPLRIIYISLWLLSELFPLS